MQVLMSIRRTVMSGEVVTFATGFESNASPFGGYDPTGPFAVSASRDAVIVHRAECRTDEDVNALCVAIRFANFAMAALAPTWRGGAASIYPHAPTLCDKMESIIPAPVAGEKEDAG